MAKTKDKKKRAGKLVPVEESKQLDGASDGLKAMSDADVGEYLKALATQKIALEGLEGIIADQLKGATQRRINTEQRLVQLRQELDQLTSEAIRIQGEIDGHTRLLVFAEDDRRAKGDE